MIAYRVIRAKTRKRALDLVKRKDESMDLMIGTVDSGRLRKDLLKMYRTNHNGKSPTLRNAIYTVEEADEQELVAIAKKEGINLRPYIR